MSIEIRAERYNLHRTAKELSEDTSWVGRAIAYLAMEESDGFVSAFYIEGSYKVGFLSNYNSKRARIVELDPDKSMYLLPLSDLLRYADHMTWRCDVCNEVRENRFISVHPIPLYQTGNEVIGASYNLKYCIDSHICVHHALNMEYYIMEPAFKHIREERIAQWLDIESAPRDGTEILIWDSGGCMYTGCWTRQHSEPEGTEQWYISDGRRRFEIGEYEPILWRPRPAVPSPIQIEKAKS